MSAVEATTNGNAPEAQPVQRVTLTSTDSKNWEIELDGVTPMEIPTLFRKIASTTERGIVGD